MNRNARRLPLIKHAFKYYAFFIALFLFSSGVSFGQASNVPFALLVINSNDVFARTMAEQSGMTLRYNRISYDVHDLAKSATLPSLNRYAVVLTATEMLWAIDSTSATRLVSFVEEGGGYVMLYRGWNRALAGLLGVTNNAAPIVAIENSKGLVFVRSFLPGIRNEGLGTTLLSDISSYNFAVDGSVSVFATSRVRNHPVAWLREQGKGRVIVWNTSLLSEKIFRGYITASIGSVVPFLPVPMMNLGLVCLDDFPNPSPNVQLEPIKSEYGMTVSEFNTFRWYPDMVELSKTYGLKFTTGLVFNYDDNIEPPYRFYEWSQSRITLGNKEVNPAIWLAQQVVVLHEQGFHGYNHQSLLLERWGSQENMEQGLRAARRRWITDNLGPLPQTYIPPTNLIDSIGLKALKNVFPELQVKASLYLGNFEIGQDREFGPEPWHPELFTIPRTSSGYLLDDFSRTLATSTLHLAGIWHHFIHPDDPFPNAGRYADNISDDKSMINMQWRGGEKKNGLFYRFVEYLDFLKSHYPWLRFSTVKDALPLVEEYLAMRFSTSLSGRTATIRVQEGGADLKIYLPERTRIVSVSGGTILHRSQLAFSNYYMIRPERQEIRITLSAGDKNAHYISSRAGNLHTPTFVFRPVVPAAAPPVPTPAGVPSVFADAEEAVAAGNQIKAIGLYRHRLRQHPNHVEGWKRLAEILSWNNRTDEQFACYEQILRLEPRHYELKRKLADYYVWNRRFNDALPLYEELVIRAPDDLALRKHLVDVYIWNSQPERSIVHEEYLMKTEDFPLERKRRLVQLYADAGRLNEAVELERKLVGEYPDNIELRKHFAELLAWNNQQDEAVRQFEFMMRANPADSALQKYVARIYLQNNRQMDAIRIYEAFLERHPGDPESASMLVSLYAWNNMQASALRFHRTAMEKDPSDTAAAALYAAKCLELGDLRGAIDAYQNILNLHPNDIDRRKTIAQWYGWNNDPEMAGRHYDTLFQTSSDEPAMLPFLAARYLELGNVEGVIKVHERWANSDPENTEVLHRLALYYMWNNRQPEAITAYNAILQVRPSDDSAQIQLARLYTWNALPGRARPLFERIAQRDPGNIEALVFLAGTYEAEGMHVSARRVTFNARKRIADRKLDSAYYRLRKEHGPSAALGYERIEDSNGLIREVLPVSATVVHRDRFRTDIVTSRKSLRDTRSGGGAEGYSLSAQAKFSLSPSTLLGAEAGMVSYIDGITTPILKAQINHTLLPGYAVSARAQFSEMFEGVNAVKKKISSTVLHADAYLSPLAFWGFSLVGQTNLLSDANSITTAGTYHTFVLLRQYPYVGIFGSYFYQSSATIHSTAPPYWTPDRLSTLTAGVEAEHPLHPAFILGAAYYQSLQARNLAQNYRATLKSNPYDYFFLNLLFEKTGSALYNATTFRLQAEYRF